MSITSGNLQDREHGKFVESPTRSGQPAVEVTGQVTLGSSVITIVDEASSTVTYVGEASPGDATSDSTWKIKKISISGSITSILMADGDANYDNVWDDRASLSYS